MVCPHRFQAVATIVALALSASCTEPTPKTPFTPDPAKQAERRAFIEKLIERGVFQKVETPGSIPRVWVTPAFMLAQHDEKKTFVSVVYAYHFPDPDDTLSGNHVLLKHSVTGKTVGEYDPTFGLKMR